MPFYENYGQGLTYVPIRTSGASTMPIYHIHPHWELYYCSDPHEQTCFVNGKTVTYTQPLAMLSSPYSQHGTQVWRANMPYIRNIFYFGDNFLDSLSPMLFPLAAFNDATACFFPLDQADCAILTPLCAQMEVADDTERILLFALFFKRLCAAVPDTERSYIGDANNYIQNIMRHIVDHLDEPLTVDTVSARFFVGRSKLTRDFRAFTGTTMHQFIANLRFARACELLRATPVLSVTEAAHRCGFPNPYYFTDFFKARTGQTPSQYAKRK